MEKNKTLIINTGSIRDLNTGPETINFQMKMEKNLVKSFEQHQKQRNKAKNKQWDYMNLKSSQPARETLNIMKKQSVRREKIQTQHRYKILKQFLKLTTKRKTI